MQKNHYYSAWKSGPSVDSAFFPIAVWYQAPNRAAAYKACGINMYISPDVAVSDLTTFKNAGISVICPFKKELRDAPDGKVIVGWLHQDEPDLAQDNGRGGHGPCIDPAVIQDLYRQWRTADPSRPVLLGLSEAVAYHYSRSRGLACFGRTEMYPRYLSGCDIVAFDIYPCAFCRGPFGEKLEYVGKGVDNLFKWSGGRKPVFADIETGPIYTTSQPGCGAGPAQVRSEVWLALIHEAAGIQYFCHQMETPFVEARWLADPPMKAAITAINLEIIRLAPVLNSPTLQTGVRISAPKAACARVMVKKHTGDVYLFVAHERDVAGVDSISVREFPLSGRAEVLGEDRTIVIEKGILVDGFSGYGVHLYRIAGNRSSGP
jgi:hypothetical protein